MNQKYPIKAFDGTNTADVSVLNLPAGSVGANGEIDLGLGVKVYRALLEAGDPAGVATVIENTLGESPTWTKDSAGRYLTQFDAIAPFTANKTFVMATFATSGNPSPTYITATRVSDTLVQIETYSVDADGVWTLADWTEKVAIQIRVHP